MVEDAPEKSYTRAISLKELSLWLINERAIYERVKRVLWSMLNERVGVGEIRRVAITEGWRRTPQNPTRP